MNLVDLFSSSSMLLDLQACDKQSANKEMLEYLVEQGTLQKADVKKALAAINNRESQASTGIGKGLAVPHAKNCSFMSGLLGVYARSEEGIPYESVDGEPVHLIFLALSCGETAEDHLGIMKRVASLHRDEKSLRFLATSTDPKQITSIFKETDEQFS
ncbi:MAG: PTS sugar transporter subunit IIA [Planctomycetota bacterium]|nr:PTS sugar transporter subunit IIA [Planctomycetota bacterium]